MGSISVAASCCSRQRWARGAVRAPRERVACAPAPSLLAWGAEEAGRSGSSSPSAKPSRGSHHGWALGASGEASDPCWSVPRAPHFRRLCPVLGALLLGTQRPTLESPPRSPVPVRKPCPRQPLCRGRALPADGPAQREHGENSSRTFQSLLWPQK